MVALTFLNILTAVLFIRGAVVIAVVDAVANVVFRNTTAIVTGELSIGVARPEQTAQLVTVVSTVVIMVTAVVIGHTTAIATSEDGRFASVEGWKLHSHNLEHIRDTEYDREAQRSDIQSQSFYLTIQ